MLQAIRNYLDSPATRGGCLISNTVLVTQLAFGFKGHAVTLTPSGLAHVVGLKILAGAGHD